MVRIKSEPEDWRVYEVAEQAEFTGSGEHLYVYLEKRNANTLDVVEALAQAFDISQADIGYAGLKDKHAVTRQWFSIPTPSEQWPQDIPAISSLEVTCLDVQRHAKKLRRGEHLYNHFQIVLRDCPAEFDVQAFSQPFANGFGPQRMSASNVAQAQTWLENTYGAKRKFNGRGNKRPGRGGRAGWHMSVLRSLLFNAVLEQRCSQGTHTCEIPGDVMVDGYPSGPLWGRGRSPVQADAALIEQEALAEYQAVCAGLEYSGLQQQRRALAAKAFEFSAEQVDAGQYRLDFNLKPGAYATCLLADKTEIVDASKPT